ncbi:MAG TPA: LysR family transcriptional regulator, partial [Firmicutes bacterium]|nr:LysR family transcriptional regulator [Bacillota bacterium]
MDFHQLRVFVEAAKEKSFSRAAEKIFLSQPTVSAHIKSLEKEIGTLLFERRQRELKLTEAGKILLRYARELLDKKEEALAVIQKDTQAKEGRLEIAASSVPGAYLLPPLLQVFNKIYPGVT